MPGLVWRCEFTYLKVKEEDLVFTTAVAHLANLYLYHDPDANCQVWFEVGVGLWLVLMVQKRSHPLQGNDIHGFVVFNNKQCQWKHFIETKPNCKLEFFMRFSFLKYVLPA